RTAPGRRASPPSSPPVRTSSQRSLLLPPRHTQKYIVLVLGGPGAGQGTQCARTGPLTAPLSS
uniref:Uncharacterized protein n=1 Tax=Spermophilus dauricus TaxID=99837 RepID=A0A8C9Q0Y7_SPEDA